MAELPKYKIIGLVENAQDVVFGRLQYEGYDKKTGYEALRSAVGYDWAETWEVWWEEGDD